jgi:anti-anti-sigma factor
VILAPELGLPPVVRSVPGWLQRFPFPGGPRLVIVLAGEADVRTSPQLRDQLGAALDAAPQELVVDVSDLTFVDLSGLDVLDEAERAAADVGVVVTVRGLSPLLRWVHGLVRQGEGGPVG